MAITAARSNVDSAVRPLSAELDVALLPRAAAAAVGTWLHVVRLQGVAAMLSIVAAVKMQGILGSPTDDAVSPLGYVAVAGLNSEVAPQDAATAVLLEDVGRALDESVDVKPRAVAADAELEGGPLVLNAAAAAAVEQIYTVILPTAAAVAAAAVPFSLVRVNHGEAVEVHLPPKSSPL